MEMTDAGIIRQFPDYRIHRHHIFRIIIPYCLKITKFALYCFLRTKEICSLYIDNEPTFCRDKINLASPQDTYTYFKAIDKQMVVYDVFNNFFYSRTKIKAANIVAETMI